MNQSPLPQHFLEIAKAHGTRGLPPVERWNPAYCGEIDMRISADGRWHYQGGPIERLALVKLFASILRKDPERYVLVTPFERVGIRVDDAPFLAVEVEAISTASGPGLAFRTNLDDIVVAGADHPIRIEAGGRNGFKPYIHVRGGLWALASRPVAIDLAGRLREGESGLALHSAGAIFPVPDGEAQDG